MCGPQCLPPVPPLRLCSVDGPKGMQTMGRRGGECLQGGEVGLILQGFLCCPFSMWKQLLVVTSSKQQKELMQLWNSLSESWQELIMHLLSWKDKKAGRGCLEQPFWKDCLHLGSKAEVAWLCHASVGFPLVLCETMLEGSKGCSQMCPLTSRWDWAAARPNPWEGLADMNACWYIESCNSGLYWSGPTRCGNYLMILGFDVEGKG